MSKQYPIHLSDELSNKVENFRWERRINKSEAIRFLIEKGFENISSE